MVPQFYLNKGRRCAQTAIRSVVASKNISLEKLDRLTGKESSRQITTPIQISYALHRLELDFIYPVKSFFLEGNLDELKTKSLKEFGEKICNKINFEFMEKALRELRESNSYSLKTNFGLDGITDYIVMGRIPIILINYDVFVGRENKKNGHYLIIHEIGEDFARVMDSGPCNAHPDKFISRKRLEDSLMGTPLDYGVIVI